MNRFKLLLKISLAIIHTVVNYMILMINYKNYWIIENKLYISKHCNYAQLKINKSSF